MLTYHTQPHFILVENPPLQGTQRYYSPGIYILFLTFFVLSVVSMGGTTCPIGNATATCPRSTSLRMIVTLHLNSLMQGRQEAARTPGIIKSYRAFTPFRVKKLREFQFLRVSSQGLGPFTPSEPPSRRYCDAWSAMFSRLSKLAIWRR